MVVAMCAAFRIMNDGRFETLSTGAPTQVSTQTQYSLTTRNGTSTSRTTERDDSYAWCFEHCDDDLEVLCQGQGYQEVGLGRHLHRPRICKYSVIC